MKKKNYNPLKMWLPYTLALMSFSLIYVVNFLQNTELDMTVNYLSAVPHIPFPLVKSIVFTILGFLLGWFIQSLWRNFK